MLYHLYREELVRLAMGMTGDISLAEETVQEAFARILYRRRALRDQQVAPCYLRRGVVAETRAVLRRRRAPSAGVAAGAFASGHAGVAGHGALLAAIFRLPARRRACLLLRLYVGLSEAETGEVLAIPPRAVKMAEHGMREVAAAGETALGAGWRPAAEVGVFAQELAGRLRDALDQLTLPEWGWRAGLADLAGRARRRRLRRGVAAVSTIVVAVIAVAALLAAPGRPGRGPQAARLAFRQLTSVWFNSPSAALAYGGGCFRGLTDPARLVGSIRPVSRLPGRSRLDPLASTWTRSLTATARCG